MPSNASGDSGVQLSEYDKKIQENRLAQKLKVDSSVVDMSAGGVSMFEEGGD